MTRRRCLIALIALLPLLGLLFVAHSARHDLRAWGERIMSDEDKWFERADFPYTRMTYLYDMGVVDANGDGHLDIYTSNHNYRQSLLLADGQGGYREVLSEWGLDQDRSLPGTEQNRDAPILDRSGLYIFWQGDILNVIRHKTNGWAPLRGKMVFYNRVELVAQNGFTARILEENFAGAAVPITVLEFEAQSDGKLGIYPQTRGTPIKVELDAPWLAKNVYLGSNKYVPYKASFELTQNTHSSPTDSCRWCQSFELNVRDRHAMLWADYNGDGYLDIFMNRGALGGMLRHFPPEVRARISDEFLISTGPARFEDRAKDLGLRKNDCSARHARWIDFDRDGHLDLFINCQDRGKAGGGFPKQLYQQLANGRLEDVAANVGLDLPARQLVDMVWFDADSDGWVDLFTHEDTGFYIHRNLAGRRFARDYVGRGPFHRGDVEGLREETTDYWQFDGKLTVADFDADGDLDVFMTSKKGNVLLTNDKGRFRLSDPSAHGLPREAVACVWVDYDNDGRPDLHCVPQGIYRNETDGRFRATNMLRLLDNKYQAAIIQWYDRDNDGRLDLLLALQDNASLWRWWERVYKRAEVKGRDDRFDWKIVAWRNIGSVGRWLQIDLQGPKGNPQAIGARLQIVSEVSKTPALQVGAHETAYSSQGHYRLYLGLGASRPRALLVRWPTGEGHLIQLNSLDRKIVLAYSSLQQKAENQAKPLQTQHQPTHPSRGSRS